MMTDDEEERSDVAEGLETPTEHVSPIIDVDVGDDADVRRALRSHRERGMGTTALRDGAMTEKARLRVFDGEGTPVSGMPLIITAETAEDETQTRQATPGPTGYATFDLTGIDVDSTESMSIQPVGSGDRTTIDLHSVNEPGASVVNLRGRQDIYDLQDDVLEGLDNQPFISPPDIMDVESAPELFNPSVIKKNGNCSIDFTAKVDVHKNYFNQFVRMTPEREEEGHRPTRLPEAETRPILDGQLPFPLTEDYPNETVEEGETPYLEHASKPSLGTMNVYKQSWTRVGHSVGKLLHSLTLAPCESTKVSIIEWSRTERGQRAERTTTGEQKTHELHRDRMIGEIVEGMVKEDQWGTSTSGQGSVGTSGGLAGVVGGALGSVGISIGGGAAQSSSESHGRRSLQANTLQNLSDNVVQRASSMRSLRSNIVTQSKQSERDEVRTRAVENHNRNHAMTIEYFQVLEHYNVHTELDHEAEVLMIPYDLPLELWDEMPDFDAFEHQEEIERTEILVGEIGSEVADTLDTLSTHDPFPGIPGGKIVFDVYEPVTTAVDEAIQDALGQVNKPSDLTSATPGIVQSAWNTFVDLALDVSLYWGGDPLTHLGADRIDDDGNLIATGTDRDDDNDDFPSSLNFDRNEFENQIRDRIQEAVSQTSETGLPDNFEIVTWLDRNAENLRDVVPTGHIDAFDALYRLLHQPENYEAIQSTVTVSDWTVELREAWRPGVTIMVHTDDGQTVTLDHDGGSEGSAVASFSSPSVDVAAIDSIEVNFAPEKATKVVVESVGKTIDDLGDALGEVGEFFTGQDDAPLKEEVENARTFDIGRIRVTAHTDPMDALPQRESYELIDETNVSMTLTAADPAERWRGISVPEPDILEMEARRYHDYSKVERLINHIQANRMAYLRRLWLSEDPDKRALRFQQYSYPISYNGSVESVPLLDLIENESLGVVGNSVAFRLLEQGQLDEYVEVTTDDLSTSELVSLPTRGVYAESLLSSCNATEIRDVDRIPTERSRCQTEAPKVTGVTPGSRQSSEQLEPTVPESTVSMQQPPNAPQPTGLSGALQLLSTPNIFRDMSLGSETVNAANSLAQKALQESGEARQQTLETLSSILDSTTSGSGGDGGNKRGDGNQDGGSRSAFQAAHDTVQKSVQDAADQAYRSSDPVRNRDHQRNLNTAHNEGAIDKEAYKRSSERLNNADEAGAPPSPTNTNNKNEVQFDSGDTLQIVKDTTSNVVDHPTEDGKVGEYYDPLHSGNQLLDTSAKERNKNLSTHFKVDEFAESGSEKFEKARIDPAFIVFLEKLRLAANHETGQNKGIVISSGYRSYKYNMDINAAKLSAHCSGFASDLKYQGNLSGLELAKLALDVNSNVRIGYIMKNDYIHLDLKPTNMWPSGSDGLWNYSETPTPPDEYNDLKNYAASKSDRG